MNERGLENEATAICNLQFAICFLVRRSRFYTHSYIFIYHNYTKTLIQLQRFHSVSKRLPVNFQRRNAQRLALQYVDEIVSSIRISPLYTYDSTTPTTESAPRRGSGTAKHPTVFLLARFHPFGKLPAVLTIDSTTPVQR